MAWRYPVAYFVDGDHLTPHEMNLEFDALVSEMNGRLDRDNFSARMTSGKFVAGSFNAVSVVSSDAAGLSFSTSATSQDPDWQEIASTTIETGDSGLQILGTTRYEETTGGVSRFPVIGILVDGKLVAETEYDSSLGNGPDKDNRMVPAFVPVGAGSHSVQMVVRFEGLGAGTFDFDRYHLAVRECAR